jgi:hypothetical protein
MDTPNGIRDDHGHRMMMLTIDLQQSPHVCIGLVGTQDHDA